MDRQGQGNKDEKKGKTCSAKINRKGSYMVEAAVILPAFIIAMLLLISIIPAIRTWENMNFGVVEELRLEMAKNVLRKNPAALPITLNLRIRKENPSLESFRITGYRYLYSEKAGFSSTLRGDDLISVSFAGKINEKNPLGAISSIRYSGSVVGRAFTGSYYGGKDSGGPTVYVFPDAGTHYHNKSCRYLKAACHQVYLNGNTRSRFHGCRNCGASKVPDGTPVFCFENSGEAYHLHNCRSVDKYYIGIGKNSAIEKGYRRCGICGG